MLRKYLHDTSIVSIEELINNLKYLLEANDKAKKTITVKKGNKIVAVLFTPCTFEKTDAEIEKLEADQFKNKNLVKENEILKARLNLLEKVNKTDDKDIPF